MDYKYEAQKILCEHTSAVMSSTHIEFETNEAMLEFTIQECGFILTNYLIEGKYTPMQYNAVRNELAPMLWKIFEPHIIKEQRDELIKLYSI
jgi:hypothetical protein